MAEVLDLYITFVLNLLVTICTIALMLSTNLKINTKKQMDTQKAGTKCSKVFVFYMQYKKINNTIILNAVLVLN